MPRIEIHNVGARGVGLDVPDHELPPEVWTNSLNMRFNKMNATRFGGHAQVFGTPTVAPSYVIYVPGLTGHFWIYTSLTKAYVYDGTTHTNITRQSGGLDVNYTASNHREWNGCVFGGIPILNNGTDLPQYWSALSAATKLANLTNFTSTLRAKIIRNFGRFLVALNLTDNSTRLPHAVQWSHGADPGTIPSSWDYTDATVDAGRTHLTDVEGGEITDALMLGNQLIVYKQRSTHAMRFVGGNDIMGFEQLFGGGAASPRFVTAIDLGRRHFVVSDTDIFIHQGTKEVDYVAEAAVKDAVFAEISVANQGNAFCFDNPNTSEVFFAYPTTGATLPDRAFVYNYKYKTHQFRAFQGMMAARGSVFSSSGLLWSELTNTWAETTDPWSSETRQMVVIADPTATKIWQLDSGAAFGSLVTSTFLERTGLSVIGKDRQGQPKLDFGQNRLVKRVWPKLRGETVINVRVGMASSLNGEVTWGTAQSFNPSTQKYLDFTSFGLMPAIRFEGTENVSWQLEGYGIEIEPLGTGGL
jgi:hypothetical protein